MFLLLTLSIIIYYRNAFGYFIGGDDIYNILNAPVDWGGLLHFFTNIQQYRPISFSFFAIYKFLPLNLVLFHAVSIFFLIFTTYLIYIVFTKIAKINKLISAAAAFCYSISHIIFHLVFTLSGIADLIFLIFFLLTILLFDKFAGTKSIKLFVGSFIFYLLSIFSKETFIIIPVTITAYLLIFRTTLSKKIKFSLLSAYWVPAIIFYTLKIIYYKPLDASYAYSLDLNTLTANCVNFALWLFNYKHGWQMGMPLPVNFIYYALVIIYLTFFVYSSYKILKSKPSIAFFLIIWAAAGLIPFFFLSRVLVYYLDISLIPFIAVLAASINLFYEKSKIYGVILLCLFLSLSIYFSQTILKQWLSYSYVANSVETAINFHRSIYQPFDWNNKYELLCILELNADASWATARADELNLFTGRKIRVTDKIDACRRNPEKSLIFINNGRNFYRK